MGAIVTTHRAGLDYDVLYLFSGPSLAISRIVTLRENGKRDNKSREYHLKILNFQVVLVVYQTVHFTIHLTVCHITELLHL